MTNLIALLAVVLIAAVLFYAYTRPDTFRVARAVGIKASPKKVFAIINDLHQWEGWSPWAKLDPAMKKTCSGAAAGQGAVYEWDGNKKVGKGRMEIIGSTPPSRITLKLDFFRPFEAHNTAEFILQDKGELTDVTWAMYGPSPFLSKLIQVFVSMDRMVGKDFASGLANLKTIAEK